MNYAINDGDSRQHTAVNETDKDRQIYKQCLYKHKS